LWYCKRSERYGGRPVWKAFKVIGGKFEPYTPFDREPKPMELFEKFIRQWRRTIPVPTQPFILSESINE